MQFSSKLAALVGGVAMSLSLAATALAEERTCRGTLGAVTVDNLRVPDDATCRLNGTYVKGTVKVEGNATLQASEIRVVGNVQAENARSVTIDGISRIGGSVQIKQGGGASVTGSTIAGDIQYDSNVAALRASSNRVGGSIQVIKNTGGVTLSSNRVDGNLQCKENRPAPAGGGNIVQGNKEDQCARL